MDLVVTDNFGNYHLVDAAVVAPCARSKTIGKPNDPLAVNGRGAAFVQGYAATEREGWKRTEAFTCLGPEQMAVFKPFVVETTGRLGGAARDFLSLMEQCHNARLGDAGPPLFRKLWVKLVLEMGMVLARGTARTLEAARDKIRRRDVAVVNLEGPPARVVTLGVDYEEDEAEAEAAVGNGNGNEIEGNGNGNGNGNAMLAELNEVADLFLMNLAVDMVEGGPPAE